MTRKSKREIERALDDGAGDERTVQAWVDELLTQGYLMEFDDPPEACYFDGPPDGAADDPRTDKVLVATTSLMEFWIPEEEVPEWIDADTLPVKA